ncbi:MAG: hypothetical protein NVSMB43_17440 [Pseudarthrobacter sp.]
MPPTRALTVRDVAEPALTVTDPAEATDGFAADPSLGFVVLLGSYQRPVVILQPGNTLDGPAIPGLRVNLNTPLEEALARSMTRALSERFGPLIITDSAGRFAGVARMERMITALAGTEPSPHRHPHPGPS